MQGLVHLKPQKDFEDRVSRLVDIVDAARVSRNCFHLSLCVDAWAAVVTTPTYANVMHAWPDQFCDS